MNTKILTTVISSAINSAVLGAIWAYCPTWAFVVVVSYLLQIEWERRRTSKGEK